ncbi:MAG: hypothetical protein JWR23_1060 [Mucilaginibacter sp.]|nr:hypothetical protein [Mucilaginibacter sp.]
MQHRQNGVTKSLMEMLLNFTIQVKWLLSACIDLSLSFETTYYIIRLLSIIYIAKFLIRLLQTQIWLLEMTKWKNGYENAHYPHGATNNSSVLLIFVGDGKLLMQYFIAFYIVN